MNCNRIVDSMSEQQDKVEKASSLKDLLMRLREINSTLADSEAKLDFLVTNSPQDESKEDSSPSGDTATLDTLNNVVDRIGRRANHMSKSTNIIVGS